MTDNPEHKGVHDLLSFRLDPDMTAEIEAIARQEGLSRSAILRRLLNTGIQTDGPLGPRCQQRLRTVHGELREISQVLEEAEEEEAVEDVLNAMASTEDAIERLG